jgi:hypothetical protein
MYISHSYTVLIKIEQYWTACTSCTQPVSVVRNLYQLRSVYRAQSHFQYISIWSGSQRFGSIWINFHRFLSSTQVCIEYGHSYISTQTLLSDFPQRFHRVWEKGCVNLVIASSKVGDCDVPLARPTPRLPEDAYPRSCEPEEEGEVYGHDVHGGDSSVSLISHEIYTEFPLTPKQYRAEYEILRSCIVGR